MSEPFRNPEGHYKIIGTLVGSGGETIELIDRKEYDALKRQLERYEHETETIKEVRAENERLWKAIELLKKQRNEMAVFCWQGDAGDACFDKYVQKADEALGLENPDLGPNSK